MRNNLFKSTRRLFAIGFPLFVVLGATPDRVLGADITAAQAMVEATTSQVLELLKTNKDRLKNDKTELHRLVNEIVVPHFDFRAMSRLVLGKHWRHATDEQKKRFTEEFKTLLVRTYSTTMLDFTDETVKYLPVRPGSDESKALCRMEITQPGGGPPVKMDLRMVIRDEGWMVYDITVDGISLVTNYRNSFGNEVLKTGIDGLINKLVEKNLPSHAG
ncbi:MAG: ABC transporter substrate-binding protein [Methylococcaceae bacterium]|nr:ABC transporter substrate-binding protein [Methylococcaceae bacterium]